MNEDSVLENLRFTVGDDRTAVGDLTVTVARTNEALLPAGSLTLTKDGALRILRIAPATNKFGQSTITLTVKDGAGLTSSTSFLLTVSSVNDLPTISPISDQNVAFNTPTAALPFQISDVETAATGLTLSAESSNLNLVPLSNISLRGDGSSRSIVVTPRTGISGSALIYITVIDTDGGRKSISFKLTVAAPVETPALSSIAARTIAVNSSTGAISYRITGFTVGAAGVNVTANSSNLDLVNADSIVLAGDGAERTITITPRANRTGTARITLTGVGGDQSASTAFNLTVTAANTAPVAQNQTVSVAPGSVVSGQLGGSDAEGQNLTFALAESPTAGTVTIKNNGSFTYTPSSSFGLEGDSFTFTVTDSGGLTSAPATVTVLPLSTSTLVVTTPADTVNEKDGKLSLREAITIANARGSDTSSTITFNIGSGREAGSLNLKITATLPTVLSNLTISNTTQAGITISGNKVRLIRVGEGGALTLGHMTLSGGVAGLNDAGGAILNQGILKLEGCTFIENTAKQGGAIGNIGVSASTYAFNTTFAANRATSGGSAILNHAGQVGLVNCTLVGAKGGASPLVLNEDSGQFAPWNTIFEGSGGSTISNATDATVASRGHNLASDSAGGTLTGEEDLTNTSPLLDTLKASKGDQVATYALKAGSPARNGGDSDVYYAPYELRLDARGQNRLQSTAVDIGAVEMPNAVPSGSFASKETGKVGTPVTFTTTWRDEDGVDDISSAQVYFATGSSAQKTGPVLRLVRSEDSVRIFFVDGGVNGTLVDITEAATAGTASTGWFSNLRCIITTEGNTLSARWTFTPLAPLVGERKAYLSVVDTSGAGGLGVGTPFGSLKITQPKSSVGPLDTSSTGDASVKSS